MIEAGSTRNRPVNRWMWLKKKLGIKKANSIQCKSKFKKNYPGASDIPKFYWPSDGAESLGRNSQSRRLNMSLYVLYLPRFKRRTGMELITRDFASVCHTSFRRVEQRRVVILTVPWHVTWYAGDVEGDTDRHHHQTMHSQKCRLVEEPPILDVYELCIKCNTSCN